MQKFVSDWRCLRDREFKKCELLIKLGAEVNQKMRLYCRKKFRFRNQGTPLEYLLNRRSSNGNARDWHDQLIKLFLKSGGIVDRHENEEVDFSLIDPSWQEIVNPLMQPIIDKIKVLVELNFNKECSFNGFPIEIKQIIGLRVIDELGLVHTVVNKILKVWQLPQQSIFSRLIEFRDECLVKVNKIIF